MPDLRGVQKRAPPDADMAALKAEALAHHHDEHGIPVRSQLLATIRLPNRLGSATAPLSHLPGRLPLLRRLLDRRLGITSRRPLPRYTRGDLVRCCGRASLPKGLLDDARNQAARLVHRPTTSPRRPPSPVARPAGDGASSPFSTTVAPLAQSPVNDR
ncbi:hypothetical protein [Streptomyces sp. G45]|uniref:hypothetical protein n=1 Tax=Streptomyces sp. G45 TaxID=3406627 RepID=UPI003C141727